ncbi:Ig-like domain-containing protein, partial [Clostridium acetobutylicum]
WVSDGAEAGTDGKGLRVEALRIKIVKNNDTPASSISLSKSTDSLKVGDTDTLSATLSNNANSKNITWTSSDSSIVSVDNNGKITALKEGTANVTASSDGKTASCAVTVAKAATTDTAPSLSYSAHVQNIG